MKLFLYQLKKDILLLLVVCLAFSMIGGFVRTDTSEEVAAPAEIETVEEESSTPAPASAEGRIVEPKVAELPPVAEEDDDSTALENPCFCNGIYAGTYETEGNVHYVCVQSVLTALEPNSVFSKTETGFTAQCGDVTIEAVYGSNYFTSNNRCFYAPAGILEQDNGVYLPAEYLVKCVGGSAQYDENSGRLDIYAGDIIPLEDGSTFYNTDDLYWLSRIIFAEAGSESMDGKIAVGNVVINRVNSESFSQDTIKGIIFAEGQFEPAERGTINCTPNEDSILAAKLALEGCLVVPDYTTYFATACLGDAFTIICWIGNHCFMTL